MTLRRAAYVAGIYEHPARVIPDQSTAQIHAQVARHALRDAGLDLRDVDAYACDAKSAGGVLSMIEYLGLDELSFVDSTETGGASYLCHVGHMAAAIAAGHARIGLVTMGGRPRSAREPGRANLSAPEYSFEDVYGLSAVNRYALGARRHMHEYGTTSEQLAMIKVAASRHAQHNPHAFLPTPVTVEEVLESPMISDPLHRMDCCVVTDGGAAVVIVDAEVAATLTRPPVAVLGQAEAPKHTGGGRIDLTYTGAVWTGPRAMSEAGVTTSDVDYASIYDSFTITVLQTIEDLGFCAKGEGGRFVMDGALESPHGRLPFNTDGGGLCNNHPNDRGGMVKIIEAVRQLRGEAHPAVQVPGCEIALAHATGGNVGNRMTSATLVLGREH